jgi:hypothetical protein
MICTESFLKFGWLECVVVHSFPYVTRFAFFFCFLGGDVWIRTQTNAGSKQVHNQLSLSHPSPFS